MLQALVLPRMGQLAAFQPDFNGFRSLQALLGRLEQDWVRVVDQHPGWLAAAIKEAERALLQKGVWPHHRMIVVGEAP